MDISALSLNELRRLQTKVEAEIRRRSDTAKKDLLKRMQKLAAEHGMSLNEVLGQEASEKPAAAPKKAAAPKPVKKAAKPASQVPPPRKPRHRLDRPRSQAPVGHRLAGPGQGPRRAARRRRSAYRSLIVIARPAIDRRPFVLSAASLR